MPNITLPRIGTAQAWRDAARGHLAAGTPPEDLTWGDELRPAGLFDDVTPIPSANTLRISRSFVDMADRVVWHRDPERFAHLYGFLWRLRGAPHLMSDRGDPVLAHLRRMEKNVRRCQHKMKAFVRFREIGDPNGPRRSFAAWFEPTHHTVEPTAAFFARRFGDMDWRIITPDISAFFENGKLRFESDHPRPDLPDDAAEDLWITYFRNIFNPARVKVKAMQSEMPKKYWKNMPEAQSIPEMLAHAPARARAMAAAQPSLPPGHAAAAQAQQSALVSPWSGPEEDLPKAIGKCTRCPLHLSATQAVPGEGPPDAALMIVGEQPGDLEDLTGRPFVGPAGKLFDEVSERVGLDRKTAFLTNAVKHFKFTSRGRKRIHQRPDAGEVEHCKWWLDAEVEFVQPSLFLAMGATATSVLTGTGQRLLARRGGVEKSRYGVATIITLHPSYLLRIPDPESRVAAIRDFEMDLRLAQQMITGEKQT